MRLHLFFYMSILAGVCAQAQTVFTTNSLPCQFGECSSSYYSTNVDVSQMIALSTNLVPAPPGQQPSVEQYWDFSEGQQPYESVLWTDIIVPQNGGDSGQFPYATYAEQDTIEPTNVMGWRYYGFTTSGTNSGRVCYGLDQPENLPVTDWALFVPPVVDIPSTVQYGQTWSGSFCWLSVYFQIILVSNYCTYSASVDAFGTLVLPGIGLVSALRVNELHTYSISIPSDPPLPLALNTNQYYFWLVPGIGVAAQVLLLGNNVLYPTTLPFTNAVQRMFYTSYFTNPVPTPPVQSLPPGDLFIQLQDGLVMLNWDTLSNAVNYRVDYTELLAPNWQILGYTTNMSWTDTVTAPQGFYRVVGIP